MKKQKRKYNLFDCPDSYFLDTVLQAERDLALWQGSAHEAIAAEQQNADPFFYCRPGVVGGTNVK